MRLWPVHERRFPAWVCALFVLSVLIQPAQGFAAAKPSKITVELRPDTTLEKEGQQIPLQNSPLFLDDRFYLSVKQIDDMFGTSTIWNKQRNVLEMNLKSPAPGTTSVPSSGGAKSSAKPGTAVKATPKSDSAVKSTPLNLNKKATPTPRNFKTPAPVKNGAKVTATPVGFLFNTPTPTPKNFSGTNTSGGGASGGNTVNGGNNGNNASGSGNNQNNKNNLNGVTATPVPTATPPGYLLRGSPTAKPTPVRSTLPTSTPSPAPIEFTRLINYTAKYLDVNYELGGALYKDVMYFRFRDVALMNVDWTGVKVYRDSRTEETFIMLEDFRNRLAQIPVMGMFDKPIIRGESDPEKIKTIQQSLSGIGSVSSSKVFWVTLTDKPDEYKAVSQNELDGSVTEMTYGLYKNASGYSLVMLGSRTMKSSDK